MKLFTLLTLLTLLMFLLISVLATFLNSKYEIIKKNNNTLIHNEAIHKYNSKEKVNNATDSYIKFLKSYKENGNEDSLLYIIRIYLFGINPEYNPDKTEGLKLINRILNDSHNFSHELKLVCKMLYDDTISFYNNDVDALNTNYKELPSNIVKVIDDIIDYHKMNGIQTTKCTMQVTHQVNRNNQNNQNEVEENIYDFLVNDENEPNMEITILNDNQNVHNHTIQNISKKILNEMNKNDNSFNKNITDFYIVIESKGLSDLDMEQLKKVTDSYSDNIHSKYNMSEKDVFNMCYERIIKKSDEQTKQNLLDIFIENIKSGIEYDVVVCSTGKITRMLSTFDVVDEELPDLKPDWIIKQEILAKAPIVRDKYLTKCTSEEKIIYENFDENYSNDKKAIHNRIQSEIIDEFKKECYNDYVKSNILSESALDVYLYDILEHF